MARRILPCGAAAFVLAVAVFYYLGLGAAAALSAAGVIVLFFAKRAEGRFFRGLSMLLAFYMVGAAVFYVRCFSYNDSIMPEDEYMKIAGRAMQVDREEIDENTIRIRIKLDVSQVNGKKAVQKDRVLAEYYADKDGNNPYRVDQRK